MRGVGHTRPGAALHVYVIAGEPSADAICARLLGALRTQLAARNPPVELRVSGVGGPKTCAAGLHSSLFPSRDLAVMGIGDVLPALPRLAFRAWQVVRDAARARPHVAVFVDGKGFSRRVAPWMPKQTLKVQYVGPSVWAWEGGESDAARFGKLFDKLLLLFPFEQPVWKQAGVDHAVVVGSPAVEDFLQHRAVPLTRPSATLNKKLHDQRQVCVMLGSRVGEIRRHGPVVGEALDRLPGPMKVIVPVASQELRGEVEQQASKWRRYHAGEVKLVLTRVQARAALEQSDIGIISSGTAGLEAALHCLPSVIIYQSGPWTERIARARAIVEFAAIPNLLMGRPVMPELLFTACTADAVTDTIALWIQQPKLCDEIRNDLRSVRDMLLSNDGQGISVIPSVRAASSIIEVIEKSLRSSTFDNSPS